MEQKATDQVTRTLSVQIGRAILVHRPSHPWYVPYKDLGHNLICLQIHMSTFHDSVRAFHVFKTSSIHMCFVQKLTLSNFQESADSAISHTWTILYTL